MDLPSCIIINGSKNGWESDGQWTASKLVEDKDGKSVDPTVGVVMILSVRITDNVLGRGHVLVDTMIVWVRISGP